VDILTENDELRSAILLGPSIELKWLDAGLDAGTIEGYASTFGGLDHQGDKIAPGAFADTLQTHRSAGTAPAMLWHHRGSEPIGRWTGMGEDVRGLKVRGALNLETARGRDAYSHLKAGDVGGLSIGYHVPVGGQVRNQDGSRLLKKIVLHEVSVTPIAADPNARVTSVKGLLLTSRSEAEDMLQRCGLSRAASRKFVSGGWAALAGEEAPQEDPALVELGKRLDAALLNLKTLEGR
jgi:uncharacterized protein